ncbi:MAG: VWA domain-containing protein [Rhizobiaceae bacterium]
MTILLPFFLIPAVACLLAAFVFRTNAERDDWQRVIDRRVMAALRPGIAGANINLAVLALAIVLAALASPSRRSEAQTSYAVAEGVIVLVDVSKSMSLTDISPDRLSVARTAAQMISKAAGARPMALIVYAGDAYLAEPFSADRGAYNGFVVALDNSLVPQQGSAPSRALSLAASILEQTGVGRARLIVLSDGGGFDGATAEVTTRIAAHGHRVDGVLIAPSDASTSTVGDVAAFDLAMRAGGGVIVRADADSTKAIAALQLELPYFATSAAARLALRSTEWQNLSHYLLLLAVVPMLLLFRESRR